MYSFVLKGHLSLQLRRPQPNNGREHSRVKETVYEEFPVA